MSLSIVVFGVSFFGLVALSCPMSFSMAAASFAYLLTSGRFSFMVLPQKMVSGLESFLFLAIPLYILVGFAMNTGGVTTRIFNFSSSLIGHVRGGLGHVNVLASMIFAGMSGTAIADCAGLGTIEMKAMLEKGYPREFSTAITIASSVVGPIIPPSLVLVVYGAIAEVSIGRLFIGGFLPGVVIGLSLMCIVYLIAVKGKWPVEQRTSIGQIGREFRNSAATLVTPLLILGGIFTGVVTPTEAGAIAVAYSIVLGFAYKELNFRKLFGVLEETVIMTASIMFIVAAATAFSWVLTRERLPQMITSFLVEANVERWAILLLINAILLVLGMFMETTSILVLTVPVLVPVAKSVGIDLTHLGVMMVFNLMIGILTPPFGMGLFIGSKISGLSVHEVTRAVFPFFVPLIVALIIITFIPDVVLFLPNMLMPSGK